jgi:hypothetical protein
MRTDTTHPAFDDEPLSDADRTVIEHTLAEPGIVLTADEIDLLFNTGADDEVRDLIAAGRVADALAIARFNACERAVNWNDPFSRPLPPAPS